MRRIESWSSPHCWWFKGYLQLQDIPRLLMIGQSDLVQPELYKIQFQLVCIIPRQATSSLILWQYMNGLWFLTFCISPSRAQPETNPSGMHNFMGEVTSVFFLLVVINDYLRKDTWIRRDNRIRNIVDLEIALEHPQTTISSNEISGPYQPSHWISSWVCIFHSDGVALIQCHSSCFAEFECWYLSRYE